MKVIVDASRAFAGVYRPAAVARYLRADVGGPARSWKVLRWVRNGLAHPDLTDVDGRDMILTFEDLISLRMIAIFRSYGHSLQRIKRIENHFRKLTNDPLPFATRPFWVDRDDIFTELAAQLVSGVKQGQAALPFLRDHLQKVKLEFDEQERANAWQPYSHVSLRPTIQFGQPCVDGTRVPTRVVWGMINRGDGIAHVATVLDLEESEVEDAYSWEQKLQAAA